MNRRRDLLHKNQLSAFREWLIADGWTIEPTKGFYEVLRIRKPNHAAPVLFYLKHEPTEHITTFGLGTSLARQFVNARHSQNDG